MTNIGLLVEEGREAFKKAGIESALLDAQILVSHVAKMTRTQIIAYPEKTIADEFVTQIRALFSKRATRFPIAYLIGSKEFYGRDFIVDENVLIPRPETEGVVEFILRTAGNEIKVLDLGAGSGAIAVTLALELKAGQGRAVATDLSVSALEIAKKNAGNLGAEVEFRQGNWFDPINGGESFDVIVSNPPYVRTNANDTSPEIKFEPSSALYSGADGLDDIRLIIKEAKKYLTPSGYVIIEHGMEQGAAITEIARNTGGRCEVKKDLAGLDRFSVVRYSA